MSREDSPKKPDNACICKKQWLPITEIEGVHFPQDGGGGGGGSGDEERAKVPLILRKWGGGGER